MRVALLVALAYASAAMGLSALQDHFIYYPEPRPPGPPPIAWPGARELKFSASDGVRLNAWFFPAKAPRASVLVAHGNAGHIEHRLFLVGPLARLGLNVMLFDYRGYGASDGTPSEAGLYLDGEAAAAELGRQAEAGARPVVYYGESLGGAVATDLAVRRPPAGLVLQSTFTSLPEMAQKAFPWLPAQWLVTAAYASIDKVPRVRCPVLVIHGEGDSMIPLEMGKRLHAAVGHGRKALVVVPGADHNDVWDVGEERVTSAIGTLIDEAVASPAGSPASAGEGP